MVYENTQFSSITMVAKVPPHLQDLFDAIRKERSSAISREGKTKKPHTEAYKARQKRRQRSILALQISNIT